ncbi:Copine family protein [Tritrichomonas foetus]|uniref:Copine family protein n=1 Tax=Tritrichomonas foetus TaxID=1144522 RepID=A0A1J4JDV3_9EUKA|nr:Copine family protein [Tritrichomonas foetus]|eukprot:OHS96833.1 Copine family protein [Tritrichomonas foetus]
MSVAYGTWHQTQAKINNGLQAVGNSTEILDTASNAPIINIHVSCKNIEKLDVGSESDPMVVMFIPVNGQYVEIARTEVIWNDCNPKFVKFFQAMYIFETQQPLRFGIYDVDSDKAPLEKHDFVGNVDTDVQYLVSNTASALEFKIQHSTGKNRGTLVLTIEQASNCGSVVQGTVSVNKLKKVRTFSKNSPYVQFSKPCEAGTDLPVFRTEVAKKCFTCTFKQFQIPLQNLCNGDMEMPINVTVMNYSSKKADTPVGTYTASVAQLMESVNQQHEILNTKTRKPMGFVKFTNLTTFKKPTFYDYIRGGIQLNLITAIDFTASNRDPCDPQSLHHLREGFLNQYEQCIWAVGNVVCPYDSDQLFAVYGFGGKINGQVSHCFPLTFDPSNPTVNGLPAIIAAYKNSLSVVQLSGPTLFAPVITSASEVALQSFQTSKTYTILLIITDGVINDMRETVDAIVKASDAPLSIIIVGVGNANFDSMDQLDGDDHPLVSTSGIRVKRDIVQFVPFNKYNGSNGVALAGEVLAEIPTQVHQYCSTHGIVPQI